MSSHRSSLHRLRAVVVSVVAACGATIALAQQGTGVFRSGADLVFVPVWVTEGRHRVPGLKSGDFALTDFVDRFGPRLAHLNTMLAVLRPLAAAPKKPDSSA